MLVQCSAVQAMAVHSSAVEYSAVQSSTVQSSEDVNKNYMQVISITGKNRILVVWNEKLGSNK